MLQIEKKMKIFLNGVLSVYIVPKQIQSDLGEFFELWKKSYLKLFL